MARDDYFVIAAKILDYLYRCLKQGVDPDPEQLTPDALGINESYWNYIFNNLMLDGYITGVIAKKFIGSDKVQVKIQYGKLSITPLGIEYLSENSTMKKALGWIQTIKDLIPFVLPGK